MACSTFNSSYYSLGLLLRFCNLWNCKNWCVLLDPTMRLTGGIPLPAETSLQRVVGPDNLTIDEHNQIFYNQLQRGNNGRTMDSGVACGEEEEDGTGNPVNFRPDIGLSDQDLILMPTKDLNKLLKKKNIGKVRQKQIKQERRTLKNRYIHGIMSFKLLQM